MTAEKMAEVELENLHIQDTRPRSLSKDLSVLREDDIETAVGFMHVVVQGDPKRPPILTYHDIGLNSRTCWQGLFNFPDIQPILKHFCVYHVNAPGQQEGALALPHGGIKSAESVKLLDHIHIVQSEKSTKPAVVASARKRASIGFTGDPSVVTGYTYPSMDSLAEMLLPVMQFYNLKTILGMGVGAGANILSRFALAHPDKVEALMLLNCSASKAGWTEWGYQKVNMWHLRGGHISSSVEEYLLWHWFGKKTMADNHDLVTSYKDYMKLVNPHNLAMFIESYVKRGDLGIVREIDPVKKKSVRAMHCPVMLVAGDFSPHLDDTVDMNGRMDPETCTWMKFECGGMIHEEAPNKLCEAFRLFLQGMGYVPSLSKTSLASSSHAFPAESRGSVSQPANVQTAVC